MSSDAPVFSRLREIDPESFVDQFRPIRNGALREILDEEFRRSYRFEGFSDLFHDLKGLFRRVVHREESTEESESLRSSLDLKT